LIEQRMQQNRGHVAALFHAHAAASVKGTPHGAPVTVEFDKEKKQSGTARHSEARPLGPRAPAEGGGRQLLAPSARCRY
jgi:hypothetical protein